MPWLRQNDSGRISETNPGGLIQVDPKNYYGAASDYSAGYAAYGTFHYTHRFQDGGELAHGAAQRRLRPRPARLDDPLLRPHDQRARRGHQSGLPDGRPDAGRRSATRRR